MKVVGIGVSAVNLTAAWKVWTLEGSLFLQFRNGVYCELVIGDSRNSTKFDC